SFTKINRLRSSRWRCRPMAQLIRGNDAIGLHLHLLDRKRFIFVNEFIEREFAETPERIETEHRAEANAQRDDDAARPGSAHLARTQFHVEHSHAAHPPIRHFSFPPKHNQLLVVIGLCRSARSIIFWQSSA